MAVHFRSCEIDKVSAESQLKLTGEAEKMQLLGKHKATEREDGVFLKCEDFKLAQQATIWDSAVRCSVHEVWTPIERSGNATRTLKTSQYATESTATLRTWRFRAQVCRRD